MKIIIILYILVKAYLDLFFPTRPSTSPVTLRNNIHITQLGKEKLDFFSFTDPRRFLCKATELGKNERREGPAFLLFRKSILVRSILLPSVCYPVVGDGEKAIETRKNPQSRLPFLLWVSVCVCVCGMETTPSSLQRLWRCFFIPPLHLKKSRGNPLRYYVTNGQHMESLCFAFLDLTHLLYSFCFLVQFSPQFC